MKLAIIGGGSWGTALAVVLAPRFEHVSVWVHEPSLAARMSITRENDVFLPGIRIPANVDVSDSLPPVIDNAAIVLGVMPSRHARELYGRMLPHVSAQTLFVSATKGLESGTLLRMSQVVENVIGQRFPPRVAALSGPTFAREVALGEPAAVVIASADTTAAAAIQRTFSGPTFRLYTNTDITGVEVGAALKNIIAIGAGLCAGLAFGSNAVAALITRGLAEITRLAVAMGGEARTLAGLAGLGDLVLTCTGELSRNRRVGVELARGRTLADVLRSTKMVAEGVETVPAAMDLARKFGVEMPITEQMDAILRFGREPREAVRDLMERTLTHE